jgi:4-amino-4-deoxy-L-arabinose transferase-like glycosyltransferase
VSASVGVGESHSSFLGLGSSSFWSPLRSAGLICFALCVPALLLLHSSLLRLPYFWDEAGYYIPAARDLLLHGSLIPLSTPSNAHPPLVMAYLALCWKLFGYSPLVTRVAMLLVASFSLTGFYALSRQVAHRETAIAATICTAFYPVFFAQSSLAHVDLAAAGLTFWGLAAYVSRKPAAMALWFSLALLAKETALLAPMALLGWEVLRTLKLFNGIRTGERFSLRRASALTTPAVVLALWYAYHFHRTGYVFGNPEFFRYNVAATLQPLRVFLALLLRLWQLLGYMNLILLTTVAIAAMWLPALSDAAGERRRVAIDTQLAFLAVILAYLFAMSVIGGAVLARYMLPAVPLVILLWVSTLRRRVRWWRGMVGTVVVAFVAGLLINPPYGFAPEDNLAYRDYLVLHLHAEEYLQAHYAHARVLTAWPASDELTRPYLGFVNRPSVVFSLEDFSPEQILAAADQRDQYSVALVFSTKYQPAHSWFDRWQVWQEWKARFFGFHRDLPPVVVAQVLGGNLVYEETLKGQWVGVIEMEQAQEAGSRPQTPLLSR